MSLNFANGFDSICAAWLKSQQPRFVVACECVSGLGVKRRDKLGGTRATERPAFLGHLQLHVLERASLRN